MTSIRRVSTCSQLAHALRQNLGSRHHHSSWTEAIITANIGRSQLPSQGLNSLRVFGVYGRATCRGRYLSSDGKTSRKDALDDNSAVASQPKAVHDDNKQSTIIYEGPFSSLVLRLKRVSITTAIISLVGVPLLIGLHGGDVPATGQLAVGGTAFVAATGSTVALHYCFSPYVHTLEWVQSSSSSMENDKNNAKEEEAEEKAKLNTDDEQDANAVKKLLLKATTRSVFATKVETIFDPMTDVSTAVTGSRPFCNFFVRGMPMYVHPELVHDEALRVQLLGEIDKENTTENKGTVDKNDDDTFL